MHDGAADASCSFNDAKHFVFSANVFRAFDCFERVFRIITTISAILTTPTISCKINYFSVEIESYVISEMKITKKLR